MKVMFRMEHLPAPEDQYWEAEKKLGVAHRALAGAEAPAERARLLYKMHRAAERMGQLHTLAFGPDPMDDEGGRDLAESWMFVGIMYGLLADVEQAIAYPGLGGRRNITTVLEPYAGEILDRMVATGGRPSDAGGVGLTVRMRMLGELIDALVEKCGGQAVESLWCLPAPGMRGPHTLAERDAWLAEHGQGQGLATFSENMDRWVPRLLALVALVVTLLGVAALLRGLIIGSWLAAGIGAVLAVGTPIFYIRRRRARQRYLDEPTEYDVEDD